MMFDIKKCRGVMFDGTEDWCKIWFLQLALLSKMTWGVWQIFTDDFILESKMAELNQNKNSKQPDRPDAVWKLYFKLEINE